jgi:hypothetical protein
MFAYKGVDVHKTNPFIVCDIQIKFSPMRILAFANASEYVEPQAQNVTCFLEHRLLQDVPIGMSQSAASKAHLFLSGCLIPFWCLLVVLIIMGFFPVT